MLLLKRQQSSEYFAQSFLRTQVTNDFSSKWNNNRLTFSNIEILPDFS